MRRPGFSLIESLIGLSLTLAILVASLAAFNIGRRVFFKLKSSEDERLSALAALDKARLDVADAGEGLGVPLAQGLLAGLKLSGSELEVESLDESLTLTADIAAGSTRVACLGSGDVAKGRIVCLQDGDACEVQTVKSTGKGYLVCAAPFGRSYKKDEAQALLVGEVRYYLDSGTVRRKANNSSAQPLVEDVAAWDVRAGDNPSLITISLVFKGKERTHEISVLAKNMALLEK